VAEKLCIQSGQLVRKVFPVPKEALDCSIIMRIRFLEFEIDCLAIACERVQQSSTVDVCFGAFAQARKLAATSAAFLI